jgi:hypothetical protein
LAEEQKAVFVFDIRMDKISNGELGKMLDLESKMEGLPGPSGDAPPPSAIERVFGAVSAPETIDQIQDMENSNGPLPVEFFITIKFNDSEVAAEQLDKMKADSESVEIGGKTFYKPKSEDAPEGILMNVIDDVTMEVGTELYLTRSDRKVFTEGLNSAWANVPDDAFRMAFDMAGAESLMEDVMAMGRENIPPNFVAYVDLLGNAKDMRLSVDLDGSNLLTMAMTGVDDDAASELQEGLDSLLGFAKMGGQAQVGGLRAMDPDAADVATEILDALAATVDGDQVSVEIPKPDGFNEAVQRMVPGGN